MIQFVWIIINDIPVAGIRFIKMTNEEERLRLEKFYGWLTSPLTNYAEKVHDIIFEGIKYYYHYNNNVLFVVGADLEEISIPSILFPELENVFFSMFDLQSIQTFEQKDIQKFRVIDKSIIDVVKAFEQRKIGPTSSRKELDAFEVLNLPSELQMVALVLVKMQVVTPDMISQVTGLTPEEVASQLNDIYRYGYLYKTTISNRVYYSVKPFGEEGAPKSFATHKPSVEKQRITFQKRPAEVSSPSQEPVATSPPVVTSPSIAPSEKKEPETKSRLAMMPPPTWEEELPPTDSLLGQPLTTKPDKKAVAPEQVVVEGSKGQLKEAKGIKLKVDPIAIEIDKNHQMTIIIPKNGFLPSNSLRREKGFVTGKIRVPNDKNKDPFLLQKLFKRDLENIFEALLMGDLIVITSSQPSIFENPIVDVLFETLNLLSPHRDLLYTKSSTFIHPKDIDIIAIPKELTKFYSWATILDLDQNKVIGGSASEFAKNLVKKTRKISNAKEYLKEITTFASMLLKIARDINTLKIEGRSPELYLTEVKKAFGFAALDSGLSLSERLIRLHKDCAYIAGFYIRKGLDVAVRALLVGEPIVVMGDDPLNVFHIIEALAIFAPHKAVRAQIWTTNYANIALEQFDMIGAQEGTDRLFKGAIKVNLRAMNAVGKRSEYIHTFLRQMWRRRSKDRPKFIREKINEMFAEIARLEKRLQFPPDSTPSKQEIKDLLKDFDPAFIDFAVDLLKQKAPEKAKLLKPSI
ncbi:MAG: hypothetical protein ACTSXO_02825 [Candidatus Heimdallarchaeota archaeon]